MKTDDLELPEEPATDSLGNKTALVHRKDYDALRSLTRKLKERLKEFDPDPVVCGCREALCPHTPIARLPRQALVDHYRALLQLEREQAERKLAEAERDAEKEWIRLGDVLTLGPDTMPSEIPELARREIISSRRQLAAVLDACEEWSGYVVEDTAPRTLLDHINRAIDAAHKEKK